MRTLVASLVVALAASSALAGPSLRGVSTGGNVLAPSGIIDESPTPRLGVDCVVDVSNTLSVDGSGSPNNVVMLVDVAACVGLPSGTPVLFNGIGWDVNLFADPAVGTLGGSWLTELAINLGPSAGPGFGYVAPGDDGLGTNQHPGTEHFAEPVFKIGADLALPDGVLKMEFFEVFNDDAGADGAWLANSTVTIQVVPEPASLALCAIGALALIRRKR